jgi:hypothetical protein
MRESGDSCEKPRRWHRGAKTLTVIFDREISITKSLTGLHRETDRNLCAAIESLDRPIIEKHREVSFGMIAILRRKRQISARID